MSGFALYRMPYARECTLLTGEVQEVKAYASLGSQQGFVMAPFALTEQEPVLVIQPEQVVQVADEHGVWSIGDEEINSLLGTLQSRGQSDVSIDSCRNNYHIDFANFHAHLRNGDFQKLVLSRSLVLPRTERLSPLTLFRRACEYYPRMFITLVYTAKSGLWLAATPEVLLEGSGTQWYTVALAGTMPWEEEVVWSDKNLQEQRYVATYITEQLELFTKDFQETGPQTTRAGHLAHLRSDFHFTLEDDSKVGALIETLHPTPAVCGLPKSGAFQFILQNEHHKRSYYSGYLGPLNVGQHTHLFVTLRCMSIWEDVYQLYAGGGLLTDSDEEQEWQETETKLDTMRHIINHHVQ